jgi:uncharacterized protein (TIGR02118 family)
MIKTAGPALKHPTNRPLEAFHRYWAESHGPLFANTAACRRYVQHLTLPEAYGGDPAPTWDGLSMFWYDTPESFVIDSSSPPQEQALRQAVIEDDRQLFDRLPGWPLWQKRASVIANERVVVEGETTPEMVKALFVVSRKPGLTHQEFFDHWYEVHGALVAKLPGLRRYVQNHAVIEALATRPMTHDGFSELWFDDLRALQLAAKSPEWRALREDGEDLFGQPVGVVVARERIQKEIGVPLKKPDVPSMTEDQIRARLQEQGYRALAADPAAPRRIKDAAVKGLLMVWSPEHIVTMSDGRVDIEARPER